MDEYTRRRLGVFDRSNEAAERAQRERDVTTQGGGESKMSQFRIVIEGETHDLNSVRAHYTDFVARLKGTATGVEGTLEKDVTRDPQSEGRGEGKGEVRGEGKGEGKGRGKGDESV